MFALAGKPLPDPVVRAEWSHFVEWFFQLVRFRGDNGLQPATIRDWGESQGISFEPWEYDIIYKMDDEYRRGQSEVMADIRNQSKR